MSRYCPSCHACILDFGNYKDQKFCDVILAPARNLGPPTAPPVVTGVPLGTILLALPLARELFAVQPPDCRYLRLAFPCESTGCFWTYELWRKVLWRVLKKRGGKVEELQGRIDALRKRILDFQLEAAASLDTEALKKKRIEITQEGDSIAECLGGETPVLQWGKFPSTGASSIVQDIACLSSIRQAVERYRATESRSSVEPRETESIGVMRLSAALKRLGAAKMARQVELEESFTISERLASSLNTPLDEFEEDVKSLRGGHVTDRHAHGFINDNPTESPEGDGHDAASADASQKAWGPKEEDVDSDRGEGCVSSSSSPQCRTGANGHCEVAVESPAVRDRVLEMKEDMVRQFAARIAKSRERAEPHGDDEALTERLQSPPSCDTNRELRDSDRDRPDCERSYCGQGKEDRLLGTDQLSGDGHDVAAEAWESSRSRRSPFGMDIMDTDDLVDYLPPLTDVSSSMSTLPMNLTLKTTASEELERLADLRGKLALEAHREEERKKREDARRLAVGRRAMAQVAASQEREAARRKTISASDREKTNLPSPVRRAKKRLARSLKIEAERKQREEEEKTKTQAEIFRKRDERISKYLAKQQEESQKPGSAIKSTGDLKKHVKPPRSLKVDYSRTPPKTRTSYKACQPWIPGSAIGDESFLSAALERGCEDEPAAPVMESPIDEVPRSPRLPDSLASGDSLELGDGDLIDDLPINVVED
ncbi:hypothetical protein FOL47_004408 [Perkinsus chesapeaki]|uniref:Uncharacterized protein n=1 Tax=Perkinsus chesapeaki TaxID=330153 RepID=A0A7J6M2Z4_PERCH|nr:hypothetical protein FOL47_004408 [Perkinsus chesapeaki]